MSLSSALSGAWKAIRGVVAPAVGYAIGGPIGGIIGGALGGGGGAPAVVSGAVPSNQQLMRNIPTGSTAGKVVLPGAGAIAAGLTGAAGGFIASAVHSKAVGTLMSDGTVRRRRRRRRGISASELKNHARVERFLTKNFKCKHGGTRGSHLRRTR